MQQVIFKFAFTIYIEGTYDVGNITQRVGINPSKTWIMDIDNRKPLYNKYSGWRLSSEELHGFIFSELFHSFYNEIKNKATVIKEIVMDERISSRVDVVVEINEGNTMPSLSLSKDQMQFLSSIKCDIDFDIYDNRR